MMVKVLAQDATMSVIVLTKRCKRVFWLLLHEVPVQLGSVYVVHYGLQPSLEPGFKSDVILQNKNFLKAAFQHLKVKKDNENTHDDETKVETDTLFTSHLAVRADRD